MVDLDKSRGARPSSQELAPSLAVVGGPNRQVDARRGVADARSGHYAPRGDDRRSREDEGEGVEAEREHGNHAGVGGEQIRTPRIWIQAGWGRSTTSDICSRAEVTSRWSPAECALKPSHAGGDALPPLS
jgi:hypothetical protein